MCNFAVIIKINHKTAIMKKSLISLTMLVMTVCTAKAQSLVTYKSYGKNWGQENVSMVNKPNGIIYRLRWEKQCTDLPVVPEAQGLELFISEPTDMGWLALYRKPMGASDYNFVVVLYDHNKKPTATINLCNITNNRYCEVQDVRWDADTHHLLFNMACPSYASVINGKGSKLYCYDMEHPKEPAFQQAARLFAEGKSVEDVAGEMLRAVSTVEGYLATAVEKGILSPDLIIDAQQQDEILSYMMEHPEQKALKPVHEHFEGRYSYLQLRVASLLSRDLEAS